MPKIGQLEAHLIRRVPNLKKMQLEKERLEQVDLENARLLGRIKKMGKRKGREFTKSSAAEDILPLVLQRRKRERKRKNKELDIDEIIRPKWRWIDGSRRISKIFDGWLS